MQRLGGLLVVLTALFSTGCSIDRIEWESAGFPVEEVRHSLEEEHDAEQPSVECIKREVGGAVWECRAHVGEAEYECEVKAGPREVIHELECEQKHEEEQEPAEDEETPGEEEAPAEH